MVKEKTILKIISDFEGRISCVVEDEFGNDVVGWRPSDTLEDALETEMYGKTTMFLKENPDIAKEMDLSEPQIEPSRIVDKAYRLFKKAVKEDKEMTKLEIEMLKEE